MNVMELAAELGKIIKADPRIEELNRARAAYEADKELQAAVNEYNAQSEALNQEYRKDTPDQEFLKLIEERIHALYKQISMNVNMVALNAAQDAVNSFMNEVNGEITYQITGERPCTHDCSTCSGCSGCEH